MSVVVAIKEKGRVYLGADSQVTYGGSRKSLSNPNNYKIWKLKGADNCLIGSVGRCRDSNVVRIMGGVITELDILHNSINFEWVVSTLVPRLFKELEQYSLLDTEGGGVRMTSSFLFAYKDQLYEISNDGCVIEIDDFDAIGSGSCQAVGSLLSTIGKNPTNRIIAAIKASATSDIYVDYPIVLSDTESTEFLVLEKENVKNEKDSNKNKTERLTLKE